MQNRGYFAVAWGEQPMQTTPFQWPALHDAGCFCIHEFRTLAPTSIASNPLS